MALEAGPLTITGDISTMKLAVTDPPAFVTVKVYVPRASAGTVKVREPEELLVTVQDVEPSSAVAPERFDPETVTLAPGKPAPGDTAEMPGADALTV